MMAASRTSAESRVSCPAHAVVVDLALRILPGRAPATVQLRDRIVRFCADPAARTALLRGPVGAGKSTLARLIALAKRVAPLREPEAREQMNKVGYEGPGRLDAKTMKWYVEFTVTGLVDELASAQLFGIKKGAATGVDATAGVFQKAQMWESEATGGVVFLDEIADISPSIQAKLLPVLSGGRFYWVGGEGDPEYACSFDGILISATWQPMDATRMRQDLLSRLTAHVIEVPPLRDRLEDLPEIVAAVYGFVVQRHRNRIKEMARDPGVDKAFWHRDLETIRPPTESEIEQLKRIDWTPYGDMRGLTTVLERIVIGREPAQVVLRDLQTLDLGSGAVSNDGTRLLSQLLARQPTGDSVIRHVRALQLSERAALRQVLMASPGARAQVAKQLGIAEPRLVDDLRQLDRSRSRSENAGEMNS